METDGKTRTVNDVYNNFNKQQTSVIEFIIGTAISKKEDNDEYEYEKSHIHHLSKLCDFPLEWLDDFDSIDENVTTIGDIYATLSSEEKAVVEFLTGCVIIKTQDEKAFSELKFDCFYNNTVFSVRMVGFDFLESEGFYH